MATAALVVLPGARAAPASLEAKRRQAAALEAEIERQGQRLSIATEEYNQASLRRERLDGKVVAARRELLRAERRWQALKAMLGQRVRLLYMYPGSWVAPLLSLSSLGQLARARVLAGSVLVADTDLLLRTERAREELAARKRELERLRAAARAEEDVLRARQAAVARELEAQQALLRQVRGEIAHLLEAERRRRLEEAARRAAAGPPGVRGLPAPRAGAPVRPQAAKAIATAAAQIGKPYRWGAAGPDAFDCSGLTMYAWAAAGVSLPHSSRAQYAALPKVPPDQIEPGDLLFYGNPIHHVGIYEGGGVMINAPETGETVRRSSIYRADFAGAARP